MTSPSATEEASTLWAYVPIADYEPPAAPVAHTARQGLADFRHLVRLGEPEPETLVRMEEDLQSLPGWQLDRIAPAPDWRGAAEALDVELDDWPGQGLAGRPVVALVGPPYGGHADVLGRWAEQRGWRVLSPPTAEQVLAGDESWFPGESSDGGPWVFPALEGAYLRHAAGLSLVRRFLDAAYGGRLGQGIVGCDSWGWAALRYVWRGRLPVTLTLQAFDQARLAACFQQLADAATTRQLLFRQSDNGQYVLPPPDGHDPSGGTSDFLQLLAAYSRGVLGVAWAFWRASLRAEPGDEAAKEAEAEEAGADRPTIPHQTIWVTPWDQLTRPSLSAGAGRDEAFVLHALLLHNGLTLDVLQQILPLSSSQVMETIFLLEDTALVARHDTVWQVTRLGYPAVRQFLQTNGYLVDQF
jgi:hypothetical protein